MRSACCSTRLLLASAAARPIDLQSPQVARYPYVEAVGSYDETRQILIDNMVEGERAGYYVITPFALQGGGWVLVNRGWVPLGKTRAERPAIPVAANLRTIRGRADNMPSPGIRMGVPAPLAPPYPVVAAYPDARGVGAVAAGIPLGSRHRPDSARRRRA